jgi:hypothetical protein
MGAPYPQILPEAFAMAAPGGRRNVIPDTTGDPQRASWNQGFPAQTMTPVSAGGKPMLGPDMNGILYMMSTHAVYAQTGQPYRWNADVVVAVAGYAAGTLLGSTDGQTLWFNTVDGNSTDPDSGGSDGWVALYSYGITTLPPSVGGILTLSIAQAKKSLIVVNGTLTSNLQVVLPTDLRRWLIVNNTTGGFSVTVRTAAGTGVVIPQAGFGGPTEVYGNGTNIYNVVLPITLPTDVAPTPNTIPLRSNAGYLYATYFNQNSGIENFTINEVYAGAGDNFMRKINRANFAANFLLSQFAGQVVNAQVPVSAIMQYIATIMTSPVMTGTPTAPTPPAGDNSTRLATTAFARGSVTAGQNGEIIFPGGIIVRWGYTFNAASQFTTNFPVAFPNNCWVVLPVTKRTDASLTLGANVVDNLTVNGFLSAWHQINTGPQTGQFGGFYIAIGN